MAGILRKDCSELLPARFALPLLNLNLSVAEIQENLHEIGRVPFIESFNKPFIRSVQGLLCQCGQAFFLFRSICGRKAGGTPVKSSLNVVFRAVDSNHQLSQGKAHLGIIRSQFPKRNRLLRRLFLLARLCQELKLVEFRRGNPIQVG